MDRTTLTLDRFGLGAKPGDRERIGDPHVWLRAQVDASAAYPASLAQLPGAKALQAESANAELEERKRKSWAVYATEVAARRQVAFGTDTPFAERWVRHFSNHFTVSSRAQTAILGLGAFEREVVRSHAFGQFSDMLLASTQHPAMLSYLDNQRSVGPDSQYALRPGRGRGKGKGDKNLGEPGLNENLAREVLELHGLGADGGYSQDDVRALSTLLTGWGSDAKGEVGGGFFFDERKHQPGSFTILGKRYGGGLDEGVRAIRDLSQHPSTARNVARRLARQFRVADSSAIASLERVFLDTGGNLRELALALINLDAAWADPPVMRTPDDWVTALVRASAGESVFAPEQRGGGRRARGGGRAAESGENGTETSPPEGEGRRMRGSRASSERGSMMDDGGKGEGPRRESKDRWSKAMRSLGQITWAAPSPEGWPDDEASWAGPEQLVRRVELASSLATEWLGRDVETYSRVESTLFPTLSESHRRMVERAGDRATALTLAYCAPEVLRR